MIDRASTALCWSLILSAVMEAAASWQAAVGSSIQGAVGSSAKTTKVVCLGDSITYGGTYGPAAQLSYPAQLQTLLGANYTVENMGMPGSEQHSSVFPYSKHDHTQWQQVKQSAADIFIVMLGSNDTHINAKVPGGRKFFAREYNDLLNELNGLRPHPSIVIAIPPPAYRNAFTVDASEVNYWIPQLVRKIHTNFMPGTPLVDVFSHLGGRGLTHKDWFPDGIHPNQHGNHKIAEVMWEALAEMHPSLRMTTPPPTPAPPYGVSVSTPKPVDYLKMTEHRLEPVEKFYMANWQKLLLALIMLGICVIPFCACLAVWRDKNSVVPTSRSRIVYEPMQASASHLAQQPWGGINSGVLMSPVSPQGRTLNSPVRGQNALLSMSQMLSSPGSPPKYVVG